LIKNVRRKSGTATAAGAFWTDRDGMLSRNICVSMKPDNGLAAGMLQHAGDDDVSEMRGMWWNHRNSQLQQGIVQKLLFLASDKIRAKRKQPMYRPISRGLPGLDFWTCAMVSKYDCITCRWYRQKRFTRHAKALSWIARR